MIYSFVANNKTFTTTSCDSVIDAYTQANAHFRSDNLPMGSWIEAGGSKTSFRWVKGNFWD